MKAKGINLDTVLALNLISREDYIAQLKSNIKEWQRLQAEQADSKTAIFYFCDLVVEARKELERLGA
jgi:hypothetical protein